MACSAAPAAPAALSTRALHRVTVRIKVTESMLFVEESCIAPRVAALLGTSPPMRMRGISSTKAEAIPLRAFVIPGPLVVRTSAGCPVATA